VPGQPPRSDWSPAGRWYPVRAVEAGGYVIEDGGGEMMAGLVVEIEAHR